MEREGTDLSEDSWLYEWVYKPWTLQVTVLQDSDPCLLHLHCITSYLDNVFQSYHCRVPLFGPLRCSGGRHRIQPRSFLFWTFLCIALYTENSFLVDACNGHNHYGVGHSCAWGGSQGSEWSLPSLLTSQSINCDGLQQLARPTAAVSSSVSPTKLSDRCRWDIHSESCKAHNYWPKFKLFVEFNVAVVVVVVKLLDMCLVLEATRTHRDVLYTIHMVTFINGESMLFKQVKYYLKIIIR